MTVDSFVQVDDALDRINDDLVAKLQEAMPESEKAAILDRCVMFVRLMKDLGARQAGIPSGQRKPQIEELFAFARREFFREYLKFITNGE